MNEQPLNLSLPCTSKTKLIKSHNLRIDVSTDRQMIVWTSIQLMSYDWLCRVNDDLLFVTLLSTEHRKGSRAHKIVHE